MRTLANGAIDQLQRTFPPNRIVVLLTPLLFAPAAVTKAYKWLDGWQRAGAREWGKQ